MPNATRQRGRVEIVMFMLAMLFVATAFLLFQFWRLLERSQLHNSENVELISLSHNVLHDNNFLIKYIRLYVLSRDSTHRDIYLNKLHDYASFFGRLERMREIGLTDSENAKVAAIKEIWAKLEKTETDAIALMQESNYEQAVSIVYGDEYLKIDSTLVATFQELIGEIELRGRKATKAMNRRVEFVMFIFSIAFLIIVFVLAMSFKRNSRLREHAERSSNYKSAFLANMSHEIRTPMNAILGITEIQLRDGNLPKEMEEALREVYNSGSLLLNIINDILDLSKIEAGKLEIVPVKYDLPSLINDAVQIACLRYDSKSIDFELNVAPSSPLNLIGDVLRLKQILNNILSNAFKYTDSGKVKMSVFSEENNETADANDVTLIFKVSDTGQGMTPEQLESLFDEYTRFNMEANRKTIGTGLGMSITKRLVDLLGGDIQVESLFAKGSTFTVRIPQKRADSLVCGQEVANKLTAFRFQSVGVSNKITMLREYMPYGSVLVVDDVKSNIFVAKGMLLPYGLKLDTAFSGIEAIEKIKAGNVYDIIFMDHMMPEMDGITAVKHIRELGYTNSIVALTANALVGQSELFLQNGFDDYISKPIDSRELNQILNNLIRDKKPPEVVKAARYAQQEKDLTNTFSRHMANAPETIYSAERYFIPDAENAINVMEKILSTPGTLEDAEINKYEITVHGIKSALKNINETELAESALKLELAASGKNVSAIRQGTPALVESLRTLIKKFTHSADNANPLAQSALPNSDKEILATKLTQIRTACEKLDISTAEAALSELNKRNFDLKIQKMLEDINMALIHSDFELAAQHADALLKVN